MTIEIRADVWELVFPLWDIEDVWHSVVAACDWTNSLCSLLGVCGAMVICKPAALGYVHIKFFLVRILRQIHIQFHAVFCIPYLGMKIPQVSIDAVEFSGAVSKEWSCKFLYASN